MAVNAAQWLSQREWVWASFSIVFVLLAFSLPLLMRWLGSVAVPAAVLLSTCLLTVLGLSLTDEGFVLSRTWWVLFHTGMAIYLIGIRYGMLFMGMFLSILVADYLAMTTGWRLFDGLTVPLDSISWLVSDGTALVTLGLLFYVHEVAQRRTMGELTNTLLEAEQKERRLESVFESTSAAICSLDAELRLVAFNRPFADLMSGGFGASPTIGCQLSEYEVEPRLARWVSEAKTVLTEGERRRFEDDVGEGERRYETIIHPVVLDDGRVIGATLFSEDIEARKQTEEERKRLHQELSQASREAGMASVASEVLHTVGNVLNSVGVSAAIWRSKVEALRSNDLAQVVTLLESHRGDLAGFLKQDPHGRQVLALLRALAVHMSAQERRLRDEGSTLKEGVEQLTRVLRAQQTHTRRSGAIEACTAAELIDVALSLQSSTWAQWGIAIERDVQPLPPLRTDRHQVIEILVNLIANARRALTDCERSDKRLVLRAASAGEGWVRLVVDDNGVGVAAEVVPKLFKLGFTTQAEGTGLGLHAAASAARRLGGTLRCESEGAGQGARFILELPTQAPARLVDTTG
ncbi:sensor histidine kinase [Haliangium sp.]|uniref:sensor histidine kinase n=1 Tax=Haliangium sp. TaxID=2663208 RepID=UPI003D140378